MEPTDEVVRTQDGAQIYKGESASDIILILMEEHKIAFTQDYLIPAEAFVPIEGYTTKMQMKRYTSMKIELIGSTRSVYPVDVDYQVLSIIPIEEPAPPVEP